MTMNYCGRCGAANGTAARYCRQCGVELHNQAAFSSGSSPLNVEFSARNTPKDRGGEIPPPPVPPPYPTTKPLTQASEQKDDGPKDPKAISESLKKLRASGPLAATAKDKKKQERINQIIDSSVGNKRDKKREAKSKAIIPVPKAPAEVKAKITEPVAKQPPSLPASTTSAAAAVNRKHSLPLSFGSGSNGSASSETGSMTTATRNTGAMSGALPPVQGPSSVLAQASGIGKQSNLGSRVRVGMIAVVVALAAGGWFLFRDKLAGPPRLIDAGRNLLSAEEQSAYLVKLAQRDREQGHAETAIGYFQNALTLTPANPEVLFMLAQTYAGSGQTDEAMKSYQSLLKIMPEHLEARLQVAELHRARGNWNAALQEYQRIITLDQNSPQAAVALSVMESQDTGKPEIADVALRRPRNTVKKAPVALPGAMMRADVSLLQPSMAAAGIKPPTLNNRPEEKPDPRVAADGHKKLGLRYFNVRQYRAAINEFLSALRLTPEDKDIYYFLGSSYYGLGEFALAHDYYRRVDSGNYVGVAQSGAARTEKAAREEAKRRELLKNDSQNQVKNEIAPKNKSSLSKNGLNNSLE